MKINKQVAYETEEGIFLKWQPSWTIAKKLFVKSFGIAIVM
jgi:hypothetical protein